MLWCWYSMPFEIKAGVNQYRIHEEPMQIVLTRWWALIAIVLQLNGFFFTCKNLFE
jgi:hypothetical protein